MHNLQSNGTRLSPCSLPLSGIKALELRFQNKGFLPVIAEDNHHPVWFQAQKERDKFLWRKGLSLSDDEQFCFWVDVQKLLTQRLSLIENTEVTGDLENSEEFYINAFLEAYFKIYRHVHALSLANHEFEMEVHPERRSRTLIVLPDSFAKTLPGPALPVISLDIKI